MIKLNPLCFLFKTHHKQRYRTLYMLYYVHISRGGRRHVSICCGVGFPGSDVEERVYRCQRVNPCYVNMFVPKDHIYFHPKYSIILYVHQNT